MKRPRPDQLPPRPDEDYPDEEGLAVLREQSPRLAALLTTPTIFDRPTRIQSGVEVPETYSGTY
jgi:hypothetical protein